MIEFIKECYPDNNSLLQRALTVEKCLSNYDSLTAMEIFCENLIKLLFEEYYLGKTKPKFATDDSKFTLHNILKDKLFTDYLGYKYRFVNIKPLFVLKNSGNKAKHDIKFTGFSESETRDKFYLIYTLCAAIYEGKFQVRAPSWDENEYRKLLSFSPSEKARENAENETSELKIKAQEKELETARREAEKSRQDYEKLKKEFEEYKLSSINSEQYKELQESYNSLCSKEIDYLEKIFDITEKLNYVEEEKSILESEKKQIESEITVMEEDSSDYFEALKRIEELENDLKSKNKQVNDLTLKNSDLEKELQETKEKETKTLSLIEKEEKTYLDLDERSHWEQKINESRLTKDEFESKYKKEAEKKAKLISKVVYPKTEGDKVLKQANEIQREIESYEAEIDCIDAAIEEKKNEIAVCSPKCPVCGTNMDYYPTGHFGAYFRCSSLSCGKTMSESKANKEFNINYDLINRSIQTIEELKENKRTIKELISHKKQERVASIKQRRNKWIIDFSAYPYSLAQRDDVVAFRSLCVPSDISLSTANNLAFLSRFIVKYNSSHKRVPAFKKNIYSMCIKLMTRGKITHLYKEIEDKLKLVFSEEESSFNADSLDWVDYSECSFEFNTQIDEKFAKQYIKKIFGDNWLNYTMHNVNLDTIYPDIAIESSENSIFNFFLSKGGKTLLIKITNQNREGSQKEKEIRDTLLSAGKNVLLVDWQDVVNNSSEILKKIKTIFDDAKSLPLVVGNKKMTIASIIVNQIAISLFKSLEMGFFNGTTKCSISNKSPLFTEDELNYICVCASTLVENVLDNYGLIYGVNFEEEKNGLPVEIKFKDEASRTAGIVISQTPIFANFITKIEKMDINVLPKNPNKEALKFFLSFIFGFDDYRQGQIESIQRFLMRKDSIVLLPTGSGKSIIYQISSFLVPGLVLVISPLVSLMEDQVSNLIMAGIDNSFAIKRAVTSEDKNQVSMAMSALTYNSTALVYVSPERLQIPTFRNQIFKSASFNNVFGIAIDEAHCVSEWGHDFRPAYLNIGNVSRSLFRKGEFVPPIVALTGTASDNVLLDVQRDLKIFDRDSLIVPKTFDREELKFSIITCDASAKATYLADTIKNFLPNRFGMKYDEFIQLNGKETNSGIIFAPYACAPKSPNYSAYGLMGRLGNMLPETSIGCYFSKTPSNFDEASWNDVIKEYALRFKQNELNLLVATKAFGMGIDKPNVRYTINVGLPTSVEEYYQEAGRAGRDRKHSECVIVFSNENSEINNVMLEGELDFDVLKSKYSDYEKTYSKRTPDDITPLLYFHIDKFKGREEETESLCDLIKKLYEAKENGKSMIEIGILEEGYYDRDKIEKAYLQAIVRLVNLGIIKDYTYDYYSKFNIVIGSFSKESLLLSYKSYISLFDERKTISSLENLVDGMHSEIDIAYVFAGELVKFIYDRIEKGRRKQLQNIYNMAVDASNKMPAEQDAFIRKSIVDFLSAKDTAYDFIDEVKTDENCGLTRLSELMKVGPDTLWIDETTKEWGDKIKMALNRRLESMPDQPGLLFMHCLAELKSNNCNYRVALDDIVTGTLSVLKNYNISKDVLLDALCVLLNSAHLSREMLYEKALNELCDRKVIGYKEMLNYLTESNKVSSNHRDYYLLQYANEIIKGV